MSKLWCKCFWWIVLARQKHVRAFHILTVPHFFDSDPHHERILCSEGVSCSDSVPFHGDVSRVESAAGDTVCVPCQRRRVINREQRPLNKT